MAFTSCPIGRTRIVAAGLLVAALLLTGCSSTEGMQNKDSSPLGQGASAGSAHQQAEVNSFPTAQQVGL
jgi:predicted small secreted protein